MFMPGVAFFILIEEINIIEIASITGRTYLRMLQRYTHLRAKDLAKKLG